MSNNDDDNGRKVAVAFHDRDNPELRGRVKEWLPRTVEGWNRAYELAGDGFRVIVVDTLDHADMPIRQDGFGVLYYPQDMQDVLDGRYWEDSTGTNLSASAENYAIMDYYKGWLRWHMEHAPDRVDAEGRPIVWWSKPDDQDQDLLHEYALSGNWEHEEELVKMLAEDLVWRMYHQFRRFLHSTVNNNNEES